MCMAATAMLRLMRHVEEVTELIGCDADEIFVTSGGTEANNFAIRGIAARIWRRQIVPSRQ